MYRIVYLIFLVLFVSCTPSNKEEFAAQNRAILKRLVQDLKRVESASDLEKFSPRIALNYQRLTKNLLDFQKFTQKYPAGYVTGIDDRETLELANQLKEQLIRIYRDIEGGRSLMEKAQQKAFAQLDESSSNVIRKKI